MIDDAADFLYKVVYSYQNKVQEIMVKQIYTSDLYGFIEIEEFMPDYNKTLIVDPKREKINQEFAQVRRSYIPIQHILRIDEIPFAPSQTQTDNEQDKKNKDKQMLFQLPSSPKQ